VKVVWTCAGTWVALKEFLVRYLLSLRWHHEPCGLQTGNTDVQVAIWLRTFESLRRVQVSAWGQSPSPLVWRHHMRHTVVQNSSRWQVVWCRRTTAFEQAACFTAVIWQSLPIQKTVENVFVCQGLGCSAWLLLLGAGYKYSYLLIQVQRRDQSDLRSLSSVCSVCRSRPISSSRLRIDSIRYWYGCWHSSSKLLAFFNWCHITTSLTDTHSQSQ